MLDPTLSSAVSSQRDRLTGLHARLAPRRASETATLEALEKTAQDVDARLMAASLTLTRTQAGARALQQRRAALEQGLSRAQRSWLRCGEPVLAGLLLFFSLTLIGAAIDHHLEVFCLEVLGFCLALWVRR